MKEMVRRKLKKLLAINARNQVTLEVSALNSNSRIREQRIRRKPSNLLGMTHPNPKRNRSNKKWPTFASWLLKVTIKYHLLLTLCVMIIVMMIMMMMMIKALF